MKALGSLLAALAALAAWPVAAGAAFPGRNGELAFDYSASSEDGVRSSREGIYSKFLYSPPSGMHELVGCSETGPPGKCTGELFRSPAYSPAGERIALRLNNHLALMDWDGSALLSLPQITALDDEPAWAPDDARIVFVGHTPTGTTQLYTVHSDGTRARRLGVSGAGSPSWSSRNRIAFEYRGGIYVVRPSGAGLKRIVRRGSDPDWSPHGKRLAYALHGRLYVARADGSHRRRVRTEAVGGIDSPTWSPNGRRLAFHLFDEGIWAVRPGGGGETIVVSGGVGDTYAYDASSPTWQPLRSRLPPP